MLNILHYSCGKVSTTSIPWCVSQKLSSKTNSFLQMKMNFTKKFNSCCSSHRNAAWCVDSGCIFQGQVGSQTAWAAMPMGPSPPALTSLNTINSNQFMHNSNKLVHRLEYVHIIFYQIKQFEQFGTLGKIVYSGHPGFS